MPVLRVVHIIFAVFVAGYYFFMVPILMPKMKKLGPSVQGPIMQAITPVLMPVMWVSAIAIVGTGVAMMLIEWQGRLGALFSTASGLAMVIGLVLTLVMLVIGLGFISSTGLKAQKLARSVQGRPPKPEETQQMGRLAARIETYSNINFILVAIVLLDMLIFRYL